MSELFVPFARIGEEGGGVEGTGIGLVITKKLVELMSGTIGVSSELGVGSVFWVEFPMAKDILEDKNKEEVLQQDTKSQDELSGKYNILYIDDAPANIRLVDRILSTKSSINMISAHDPQLGLDLAISEMPDLILLDINLPGMNGFEVLKELRANDKTKNISVFAISGNSMLADIKKAIDAGFDDYITKPFEVKDFFVSIMKVLNKL